jgi:hypothetical protein
LYAAAPIFSALIGDPSCYMRNVGNLEHTVELSVADRMARVVAPGAAIVMVAILLLFSGEVQPLLRSGGHGSAPRAARSAGVSHMSLSSLPVAARGVVSEALGADDASYRMRASGGGFQAVSQAQGLRLGFGRAGIVVESGATRLGLRLRAVGYGASLRALGEVAPRAHLNRVVYAHVGVSEWFVNGPLGLEQGFTVSQRPRAKMDGSLILAMVLSGDLHASLGAGGQDLTLSYAGKPSLRYGDLVATDAGGRKLRSWLVLEGRRLLVDVDAGGARYPLRIDPLMRPYIKLTGAPDPETNFGSPVALSSDGSTALIGGGDRAGAAWVFVRSGSTWRQQARLAANGGVKGDSFGCSMALSADGDTVLVTAPGRSASRDETAIPSSAWVFARSGGTWTQQSRLTPGAQAGPEEALGCGNGGFGSSTALSGDGRSALVGAPGDDRHAGAVWRFTRSGAVWTQAPKLIAREASVGSRFGHSVGLSSDGNTALVGGPSYVPAACATTGTYAGAGWVFIRTGGTWSQQGARLAPNGGPCDGQLGSSVALSSDGNTALIASNGESGARVFTRSASTWSQQGPKLSCGGGYCGEFALSVALSGDGNEAMIGGVPEQHCGRYMYDPCGFHGMALTFSRFGATWVRQGLTLTGSPGFGYSVALSGSGDIALIAAPADSPKGAVFVSMVTPPPPNSFSTGSLTVKADGTVQQQLASSSAGTFTAMARVSPRALHLPHARSPRKLISYGTGIVRTAGPSVVTITIKPTAAVRVALTKHRRLEPTVHITISFSPNRGVAPSRQTATVQLGRG